MSFLDLDFELDRGNPGAIVFTLIAYDKDPSGAEIAFHRARELGIVGSRLYILWNDCCGRDTDLALMALRYLPDWAIRRHINGDGVHGSQITKWEIEEVERYGITNNR